MLVVFGSPPVGRPSQRNSLLNEALQSGKLIANLIFLAAAWFLLIPATRTTSQAFTYSYQQQQQSLSNALLQEQQQALNVAGSNTNINTNNNNNNNNFQLDTSNHQSPNQDSITQPQYPRLISNNNQQTANQQFINQAAQQQQPSSSSDLRTDSNTNNNNNAGPILRYYGVALNSSSVKLVWNVNIAYHADYFDIKYGPIPDTETFSIRLNGSARDAIFHQLTPETLYQFRLHGFYHNAEQTYKPQLVVVKTQPINHQSKSQAEQVNRDIMPFGVKAEAKSNNSIQLSWVEPDRPSNLRNSVKVNIIRYYINPAYVNGPPGVLDPTNANNNNSVQNASSNNNSSSVQLPAAPQYHYLNVTNPRESRLIVQRLKPATEYAFAIKTAYYSPDLRRLYTQSGFSMDTITKTFDLEPSAPRNFTFQVMPMSKEDQSMGQTPKLELNWLAPESPNGQLKGYVILYAHDQNLHDDKWSRIYVNDSSINNWYVANLRAGHSYYFKMRAINQRGQSGDSETRLYMAPAPIASTAGTGDNQKFTNMPIPATNVLMFIIFFLVAILCILSLLVSKLFCNTRKPRNAKSRNKANLNLTTATNKQQTNVNYGQGGTDTSAPKLNGFASTNSSSTVTARVGTLARRNRQATTTDQSGGNKTDFWISAIEQQQQDVKSNMSEKSNSDINMAAMVSIQRDSPQQFVTQTQLAPMLPEYQRQLAVAVNQQQVAEQQLMNQLQGHYHSGHQFNGLNFDQMDNATASALMTLTKRQQQQMQKYQYQFAATSQVPPSLINNTGNQQQQATSPHQQPPPPPPLNIEQQQQQHMVQQQPLYGTHQQLASTRSLRLHRPTLYDPVSGSFVQGLASPAGNQSLLSPTGVEHHQGQPPNYNSHLNQLLGNQGQQQHNSNTLQFSHNQQPHHHQTSTLLSRRSTNTLRSFQSSHQNNNNTTYGHLGGFNAGLVPPPPPPMVSSSASTTTNSQQQPQQLLQSHQAVINQLNNTTYHPSSLPLKHVSAVRPQIMSSLEDQIEMELAEKEQQQQQQQQHQQQSLQSAQDQQSKAIKQ